MIYVRSAIPDIPWEHWLVMAVIAIAVALWGRMRKKFSVYGAVALGCTVLFALYLIDAAVVVRWSSDAIQYSGLDLKAEYHRIVDKDLGPRVIMLFNVIVFIPFGVALSEYLCATRTIAAKRCLGYVALTAFGLSLSMECLQLLFKVGLFEITDMVLNTLGAVIGAAVSLLIRRIVKA